MKIEYLANVIIDLAPMSEWKDFPYPTLEAGKWLHDFSIPFELRLGEESFQCESKITVEDHRYVMSGVKERDCEFLLDRVKTNPQLLFRDYDLVRRILSFS